MVSTLLAASAEPNVRAMSACKPSGSLANLALLGSSLAIQCALHARCILAHSVVAASREQKLSAQHAPRVPSGRTAA